MLVISRKENEAITILPSEGIDPTITLQQVFERGPIVFKLIRVSGGRVRVAIDAPVNFRIWRGTPLQAVAESAEGETHASTST